MISFLLYVLSCFLILTGIMLAYQKPLKADPFTMLVTSILFIVGGALSAYYLSWLILISTFLVTQIVYGFGYRKAKKSAEILSSEEGKLYFKNNGVHLSNIVSTFLDIMQSDSLEMLKNFKFDLRSVTDEIDLTNRQVINKNPTTIAKYSDFFQIKTNQYSGILEFHENNDEMVCIGLQMRAKKSLSEVQFNMLSQVFAVIKPHYGDPVKQIPNKNHPNIMKFEDSSTICVVTNDVVKIESEKKCETIFRIFNKAQLPSEKPPINFLCN